ncbi:F-box protein At2g17036 [Manihot esculenta]|uniref:F-box domain-containing protein n=1 Tax=Manihot esculenta TaxID=3983 RepID=A0A2C9UDD6_MANES|nr:F-box protein At2g17036 [Manihot esculenta]OAY28399.1 hypothetical protein MANES_15G063400v8 [Manihot esculenta]
MAFPKDREMSLISWSDLPDDLLFCIGKRLEDYYDIVRFRAVCHSWRCSIAAPRKFPALPLHFHLLTHDPNRPIAAYNVFRRTVFRLELPAETQSSQPPFNNVWLIKVEEERDEGNVRLINPFSSFPMEMSLDSFPNELNLLNFRLKQISTCFSIERFDPFESSDVDGEDDEDEDREDDEDEGDTEEPTPLKVVFSTRSRPNDVNSRGAFAIIGGEMYSLRISDELWNLDSSDTNYKRNVFTVISRGLGSRNNGSSLNPTHLVLPPRSFSGERFFVESCGDLFLVSRDFTVCSDLVSYDDVRQCFIKQKGVTEIPIKFEVLKMNMVSSIPMVLRWEAVSDLGDRIFCLSRDCSYSIAAEDLPGCKGNCIYFVDEVLDHEEEEEQEEEEEEEEEEDDGGDDDEVVEDDEIFFYNLEDGSAGPLSAFPGLPNIFWPPAMFGSNPSSSGE